MSRKQKRTVWRIVIALVLFAAGFFLPEPWPIAVYVLAWALTGYETVRKAVVQIGHGQIFDENFLMTIATLGAFALQDWSEAAAVMIFFRIGELFESLAVARSRRSISHLMNLRPDAAYVWRDGEVQQIEPEQVQPGDLLRVRPGERIPVDGVIVEGQAAIDTSAITGESLPRDVAEGSEVLSGCVNLSGVLKIEARSAYQHSTVARILDLVESSVEKKAQHERMITKFARYYTPIVVAIALVLALLVPLVFAQPFGTWVKRALVFLVISCPCALVISVPLSFFGGMGAASKAGMIVKGGVVLEKLAALDTVVLDKTGTLTSGSFGVQQVYACTMPHEQLLALTAAVERDGAHPIAQAIRQAAGDVTLQAQQVEELPGFGVQAVVDGAAVLVGNEKLMQRHQIAVQPPEQPGTVCYVAVDGVWAGWILLADQCKPQAANLVPALKKQGVQTVWMLTGDHAAVASQVAKQTGVDGFYAELLPQDKVEKMEQLQQRKAPGKFAAFVGDGVNDAPVLAMADVGVAMGAIGSDAAVEAADLVILNDDPAKLCTAMILARKTRRIARQNIIFAIGVKVLVMLLGALGLTGLWMAIFADVGVAVLAILNAMRTMRPIPGAAAVSPKK